LYVICGLGVRHIELLSGQPAQTILRLLHAQEIQLRPAGGRSPFMRRWRAGATAPDENGSAAWPMLSDPAQVAMSMRRQISQPL
jgi:hypothetical protein